MSKQQFDTKMEAQDAAKRRSGWKDPNAGYSTPGYNYGLGTYIRNKHEFKAAEKEAKARGIVNNG